MGEEGTGSTTTEAPAEALTKINSESGINFWKSTSIRLLVIFYISENTSEDDFS